MLRLLLVVALCGCGALQAVRSNGDGGLTPDGGVTQIETIATGLIRPNHLSVQGDQLYFLNIAPNGSGGPVRMPKAGGAVIGLDPRTLRRIPTGLAVSGDFAYWTVADTTTNTGLVLKTPLTSGQTVTLAARHAELAMAVVSDGTNVYWSTIVDQYSGSVLQMPVEDGETITLATDQANPWSLAVEGTSVYWANWAYFNDDDEAGHQIMRAPIGGGTLSTLATADGDPFGIVADANHLYWLESAVPEALVWTWPTSGGSPSTLATADIFVDGDQMQVTALDSESLYCISGPHNDIRVSSVLKVSLQGGNVTTLATSSALVASIAVDDTSVYLAAWDSSGVGKILRLPK